MHAGGAHKFEGLARPVPHYGNHSSRACEGISEIVLHWILHILQSSACGINRTYNECPNPDHDILQRLALSKIPPSPPVFKSKPPYSS